MLKKNKMKHLILFYKKSIFLVFIAVRKIFLNLKFNYLVWRFNKEPLYLTR